jgi:hypothetical protein
MTETQNHGFAWETEIATLAFELKEKLNYTATHDIPKELNKFDNNENVSIKTTGSGTVCMGDAVRVFRYTPGEKHTAIIVKYTQEGTNKKLTNVYELDLDNRSALWGSVTLEDVQELNTLVCSMPHGKERDAAITNAINAKKKELNSKSGLVRFNPKIDSKKQRRLQCSIAKFSQSVIVKSSTTEAIVRGVVIKSLVASARRVLKGRV